MTTQTETLSSNRSDLAPSQSNKYSYTVNGLIHRGLVKDEFDLGWWEDADQEYGFSANGPFVNISDFIQAFRAVGVESGWDMYNLADAGIRTPEQVTALLEAGCKTANEIVAFRSLGFDLTHSETPSTIKMVLTDDMPVWNLRLGRDLSDYSKASLVGGEVNE